MMNYRLYKQEDYPVSKWSGGKTTQFAIYPENSDYISRNFLWRLSSATVELEESDFTRLPDYDRVLMVLSGSVVLNYGDKKTVKLSELEQDGFDGAIKTKSFGKITDYNLMFRKGSQGHLTVLRPHREKTAIELKECGGYTNISAGLYCRDGYAIITIGNESCMVAAGQQLVINCSADEPTLEHLGIMGEGLVLLTQVNFNEIALGPEIIPPEKATVKDFKEAAKISLTQFRGSQRIFPYLKEIWYDEALQGKIDFLERTCVPVLVCFLGIAILGGVVFVQTANAALTLGIIAAWVLLDVFILSPFIYFLVLPKPIAAHIKRIDSLNEYERGVYERSKTYNYRLEKLMKKYKNSGRNFYS